MEKLLLLATRCRHCSVVYINGEWQGNLAIMPSHYFVHVDKDLAEVLDMMVWRSEQEPKPLLELRPVTKQLSLAELLAEGSNGVGARGSKD